MNLPSKELLSEVLKVETDSPNILNENILAYGDCSDDDGSGVCRYTEINIYELAHKCKEWAKANGYAIWTTYEGHCKFGKEAQNINKLYNLYGNIFSGCDRPISESDSVFAACQWILDQKDNT
jgi:hypothetical protein